MKRILLIAFILGACSSDNTVSSNEKKESDFLESSSSSVFDPPMQEQESRLDFDAYWPKDNSSVSRLAAEFHIDEGEVTEVSFDIKSQNSNFPLFLENVKGDIVDAGNGWWRVSVPEDFYKHYDIVDGYYSIWWNLKGKKNPEASIDSIELSAFYVKLDRTPPKYELEIRYPVVSGNSGEIFGGIEQNISEYTKFIRAFAILRDTKDTIEILNKKDLYYFFKKDLEFDISDTALYGPADLYIQGFDEAFPNREIAAIIDSLDESNESPWEFVLKGNSFIEGINGTTVHREIFIDNKPPRISSLKAEISSGVIEKCPESCPPFQKIQGDNELLLNNLDTLILSFDVSENLSGADSTIVKIQISFMDSTRNENKTYEYDLVIKDSMAHFEFVQTEYLRSYTNDGTYTLSLKMTDERKNSVTHTLPKKIRLDNAPPRVESVTTWNVKVADFTELHEYGTIFLNQLGDVEENRSDLYCFIRRYHNGEYSEWKSVGIETDSKTGKRQVPFQFDYLDMMSETDQGRFIFYGGCFDEAGNFSKEIDFFDIGE